MLDASSAEAEAEAEAEAKAAELPQGAELTQGAELPQRAELPQGAELESRGETTRGLAAIQATVSECEVPNMATVSECQVPSLTPPPTTLPRVLSAPASQVTASHITTSHVTTSHVTTSHVTTSHGGSNGGGTAPQIHNQMHGPRGLQLLAFRPAEVVCLDDDGLPMRIVWDAAGHPVRSPVAADTGRDTGRDMGGHPVRSPVAAVGAPSSLSIVREDVGGAGRISNDAEKKVEIQAEIQAEMGAGLCAGRILTDADADMLLPRSPSRLCLDFLSDALVSLPRSPSRLQLDDDADSVVAAAGAGVHEVASKVWCAVVGVWRALARSVLHADADTSVGTVADAEAGSVIAPADGPQRFPLSTADKLRGAALDLVLGRFARRLRNLGLSRGFDSWAERWRECTYAMVRVRACTGRVALQQLADAFGFWARPPEWVWKSLEYDDEVCNQGRDTGTCGSKDVPRIVPGLDASDCAWPMRARAMPMRASIATLFVHTCRSPLPNMPHTGVESL